MSINNRTIYFDNTTSVVRFWDWASVDTTLGYMAEPFMIDSRHSNDTPTIDFDPADEIAKITDIRARPVDESLLVLSGGQYQLHGGYQIARDGK